MTVFISNVLLLIMKLYDTVSLTRRSSKENKVRSARCTASRLWFAMHSDFCDACWQAISTALKEPVYFNVIDPRYLKH